MLEIITTNSPLFLAGVFVVGLLIGSFLNVVIPRLPARLQHEWRSQFRELLELADVAENKAPQSSLWYRSECP